MADQIGLNEQELDRLQKFLDKFILSDQERLALGRQIGTAMVQSTKQRFNDSQSPEGEQWLPLKQYRGRGRDKRGISNKIGRSRIYSRDANPKPLIDTGRLRSSITFVNTPDYIDIGTNVAYAAVHQYGYKNIPQRKFIGISEKDTQTIQLIVETFLKKLGEIA